MPSLRNQSVLDFPVQKTSRSRSVKKTLDDDLQSPRKRRTRVSSVSENEPVFEGSPTKKTRTQKQSRDSTPSKKQSRDSTPSKKQSQDSTPSRDSTPSKKGILSTPSADSPPPRLSGRRKSVKFDTPVSPRRSSLARSENRLRTNTSKVPEVTVTTYKSPKKSNSARATPLSPIRNIGNIENQINNITPRKSPLQLASPRLSPQIFNGLPSARALDFSPCRRLSTGVPQTPPKQITIERYTPTKRALNFSPGKEMRLGGSPARKLGTKSPRKLVPGLLASPCKTVSDLMASPRKMGNPLLCSPRKDVPPLSPRKLDVRSLTSPMRLAKQEGICYQRAKQALHTALPDRIVCRDSELNRIQGFIDKHVKQGGAGSLYISGAPGTGKTAVLSHILQNLSERADCQNIYINCMNAKNSQAIFNQVQSELQQREISMPTKQAVKQLEKALCAKGKPVVLILDEIDQLDSRNQDVLYTMFEWPALKNSRLVLIGIANALDLTDRILPRLQARPNCCPELLNFEPYTKEQIVAVLKDRLNQVTLEGHVVLDPTAVQFCARKVAAVAGDMRRALDVCRRAVEMVEADVRKQPVLQPTFSLTGSSSPSKRPPVPKKITVVHIMKTLNEVYGNGMTNNSTPQTIPLQEKLAICSLLLLVKYGNAKEVTLGKLHDTYRKVCAKQQVAAIGQSEFHSLCSLIESKGICRMKKAKDARSAKVTLKLDESELEQALQDKVLMSTILQNGLPK